MHKSNFGVSVGAVGAAAYLLTLFGGYTPALLLVGYILLFENNNWLKRVAVKAIVLQFLFSLSNLVIGLIPDVIGVLNSFASVFGGNVYISFISLLCNALQDLLSLVKVVLMLVLSLKALKQSTVVIGFIDNLINKCME